MENIYILKPDNEWEIPRFLLNGGVYEGVRDYTLKSFRQRLKALEHFEGRRSEKDKEKKTQLYKEQAALLSDIRNMILGCHFFLHQKKRLNYIDMWIDQKWIKNPYRCLPKYRPLDDKKINHHLAHFDEPFMMLKKREGQNFQKVFEDFFKPMDLSVWLRMLYRWESTLEINRSIAEFMGLNPFKIFEAILRLHEACVVAMGWANLIYNPPNYHLWNYYLGSPCDGYDAANPYENISGVFGHMSYNDIAVGIRAIYLNMHTEEDQIKEDITQFRFVLKWLIETGWVLLQTDYYPKNWLDPNFMDHLHCAFSEKDLKFWRPENLDKEERENVVLTLSKLYQKVEVREFIYRVENRVIKYSEDKSKLTVGATDLETATTLLKILDVITMLDVDFCKRRTKVEGLHYKV